MTTDLIACMMIRGMLNVMNKVNIEKELENRKKMDSTLTNMIIPILVFIAGIIYKFDFLFDFRNDYIPLFYRIVFITFIMIAMSTLLYLCLYLVNEIRILNIEIETDRNRLFLMKENFYSAISFWRVCLYITVAMSVLLFLISIFNPNAKIINNFKIILMLIFAFALFLLLIKVFGAIIMKSGRRCKNNNNVKNGKGSMGIISNIITCILQSLICLCISLMVIWCLLCFNNKRNIDIYYNENGLIKIYCDFDIDEEDNIRFELKLSTISQISISNKLTFSTIHFTNTNEKKSTVSILDFIDSLETYLSPFDFSTLRLNNYFYINLDRFNINGVASDYKSSNNCAINLLIHSNKHSFIVSNNFERVFDNYEFAQSRVHLSFLP